jgi:nuclear protein localization protein 4 homolog
MDSQYEFKIQRQKDAVCKQVSLDSNVIIKFQTYLQKFNFQRKRYALLYGKFVNEDGFTEQELLASEQQQQQQQQKNKNNEDETQQKPLRATRVIVEAIYEPPQQIDNETAEGFVPVDDDPYNEPVQKISSYLGLQLVGWIYGHETREPGYVMSAGEVIMAAEYQLDNAKGVYETPFVTIKVTPSLTGQVSVEAFQVSQQCMAMVAEEALDVSVLDPKYCLVNKTFTAIQEGKASDTVENNFFITVVPIVQHTSEIYICDFPCLNRDIDDHIPSTDEVRVTLSKSGKDGWTFEDRLCDFNLLLYLSQFFDITTDYPKICHSLLNRQTKPLEDGYKILIKSIAGLDSSY